MKGGAQLVALRILATRLVEDRSVVMVECREATQLLRSIVVLQFRGEESARVAPDQTFATTPDGVASARAAYDAAVRAATDDAENGVTAEDHESLGALIRRAGGAL